MPNRSPNHRRGRGRGQGSRNQAAFHGPRADAASRHAPPAGGVFERLKMPCPSILGGTQPNLPCSATVPITFRSLPVLINKICYEMESIKARSRSDSSSDDSDYEDPFDLMREKNKATLIKGSLILAEVKVYFANEFTNYTQLDKYYSCDFRKDLEQLALRLPKPLVEYLECLGNTSAEGQEVTPVLAGDEGAGDGDGAAPALAPCQLAPLLARLRGGVPAGGPGDARAGGPGDARAGGPGDARAALRALPLRWEQAGDTLRLAEDCFDFWVRDAGPGADPRYTLRWNDEDKMLFLRIIDSVWNCKGAKDFLGSTDLSRGEGSPAQFVQTPDWNEYGWYKWFTMTAVDEESLGKGAVFGFGGCDCDPQRAQPSRFAGTIETSFQSGDIWGITGIRSEKSWDWKELHRRDRPFGTVIPVTFSGLPGLINRYWGRLEPNQYDASASKAVLIKAGLILAEAKVYFAQMASKYTVLHPGQMVKYSTVQEGILKRMPKCLPARLGVYLECLGNTIAEGQEVTPVLAGDEGAGDGDGAAPALAPCQLAPLLARLRGGVPAGGPGDARAGGPGDARAGGPGDARAALRALPLRWEQAGDTLRLAEDCFDFWVRDAGPGADPRYTLRWNDEDSRLFEATIRRSTLPGLDNLVYTDLTHGKGSPAQFVRRTAETDGWFVMTKIDDWSLRLGAVFGFGDCEQRERCSRLAGPPEAAYMSIRGNFQWIEVALR